MIGLDDLRIAIQSADDFSGIVCAFRTRVGDFVQDHNVCELDLLGQQADKAAIVFFSERFPTVVQKIMT